MRAVFIPLLLLLITACSATRLTDVWTAPEAGEVTIKKLVVVGVSKSQAGRRRFEDELVRILNADGISAIPSYHLVPDQDVKLERIRPLIKDSRVDAILVSRLVGINRELRYVPGTIMPYYTTFDRYYFSSFYHPFVYEPGMFVVDVQVVLETNLYESDSGRLIWSARSETTDPASAEKLARSLGPKLFENLQKQGILRKCTDCRPPPS